MIWFLYNLLLVITAIFWVPWMLLRANKRREKPNWRERTGEYDVPDSFRAGRRRIWIHAVSVGEVMAARPILSELRQQLPGYEIVLTCTTSTGHSVASALVGKSVDRLYYFPIDVPRFCMAALVRVQPSVVAIMETELWLNFLTAAKAIRAKTCIVNGRISDRSYGRSKHVAFFYKTIFGKLDAALMQTATDADRAKSLGASAIQVLGNSKYDEAGDITSRSDWRVELGLGANEVLIVVGSARGEDEERLVIAGLRGIDARIVFAPRHIERADDVAEAAAAAGFNVGLRSRGESNAPFLVLDTFGELGGLYGYADLAIVGGGFSPLGGQNIIQPMAAGCPVICGPHMKNFREPFEEGLAAGALRVASTPEELQEAVRALLADEGLRATMGAAGKALVDRNRGASARYAKEIARLAREFEAERA
jgi:3-deoxy-D-manno-octulosonic-acid transferase